MAFAERNVNDRGRRRELRNPPASMPLTQRFVSSDQRTTTRGHIRAGRMVPARYSRISGSMWSSRSAGVRVGSRSASRSGRPCGTSGSVADPRPDGRLGDVHRDRRLLLLPARSRRRSMRRGRPAPGRSTARRCRHSQYRRSGSLVLHGRGEPTHWPGGAVSAMVTCSIIPSPTGRPASR